MTIPVSDLHLQVEYGRLGFGIILEKRAGDGGRLFAAPRKGKYSILDSIPSTKNT